MATVSLSPTPAPLAAMASRRVPLSNNPNVANSPLRGPSALAAYAKQKRSHATIQREEPYGQAPPMKKQVLDNGSARVVRSPSKLPRSQTLSRGTAAAPTRPVVRDRQSRPVSNKSHDVDTEKEVWKRHHRAKFPKMVFYFESIPDDIRAKLIKRVTYLGAVRLEPLPILIPFTCSILICFYSAKSHSSPLRLPTSSPRDRSPSNVPIQKKPTPWTTGKKAVPRNNHRQSTPLYCWIDPVMPAESCSLSSVRRPCNRNNRTT